MQYFEQIGPRQGCKYKRLCPGYGRIDGCSKWFVPTKQGQKYCMHCEEVLNEQRKASRTPGDSVLDDINIPDIADGC